MFDRIDVTNLLDGAERVRIPSVLTDWGPMLKENKYATLLGFFTEWQNHKKNASGPMSSEETKSELISMLIKDGRVCMSFTSCEAVHAQSFCNMIGTSTVQRSLNCRSYPRRYVSIHLSPWLI
jgi:hypothetical protein